MWICAISSFAFYGLSLSESSHVEFNDMISIWQCSVSTFLISIYGSDGFWKFVDGKIHFKYLALKWFETDFIEIWAPKLILQFSPPTWHLEEIKLSRISIKKLFNHGTTLHWENHNFFFNLIKNFFTLKLSSNFLEKSCISREAPFALNLMTLASRLRLTN